MKRGAAVLTLLALAAPAAAERAAPAVEIVWPADAQPHVPIVIKNTPLNARLALGFDKALLLNATAAERARLKAFPIIGKKTVKNPLIPGGEAVFRGNIYDVASAGLPKTGVPTAWVDKPIAEEADGIISVLALAADRVTLAKGPSLPGGLIYTLTRPGEGNALMKTEIGGETVRVGFDLRSPDSVANSRGAAALEAAGLVKRSGKVGLWTPFPGVALPFERLVPVPGAKVLGLPLARPAARITEARARALDAAARAGTSTADDDGTPSPSLPSAGKRGPIRGCCSAATCSTIAPASNSTGRQKSGGCTAPSRRVSRLRPASRQPSPGNRLSN